MKEHRGRVALEWYRRRYRDSRRDGRRDVGREAEGGGEVVEL